MLQDGELILRPAADGDQDTLWHLIYATPDWKEFDAPYYPLGYKTFEEFEASMFKRFFLSEDVLLIEYGGEVIGCVSCYWEDEATRWLEAGIVLYSSANWGKRIGRRSLTFWITHLFATRNLERIGLTTWSGNPRMIATAKSLGIKVEGRLRKVRYYKGQYYDSIKMGILREEWTPPAQQSN